MKPQRGSLSTLSIPAPPFHPGRMTVAGRRDLFIVTAPLPGKDERTLPLEHRGLTPAQQLCAVKQTLEIHFS